MPNSVLKIVLFLLIQAIIGGFALAQDTSTIMQPPMSEAQLQQLRDQQANPHARVYAQARRHGDHQTAIQALHYLLVEEPGNRYYKDSLVALYLEIENVYGCKVLGEEILNDQPDNNFILNIMANIYLSEGRSKEALQCYESLEKNTELPYFTYQTAVLRFQLERYGECREAISTLMELPSENKASIRIFSDKNQQTVPIQAAALNLRGNLELKLGNKDAARADFQKALEISPDFLLPKGNLDQLDE